MTFDLAQMIADREVGTPGLSPLDLRRLLSYNEEDGMLTWRERSVSDFSASGAVSALNQCVRWNNRFAGMPALIARHKDGYLHGMIWSKCYLAHRVALAIHHGEWPNMVDHINGIRTDNRIANIRSVSAKENARNSAMRKDNKSGASGVFFLKRDNRWAAYVRNGKANQIGTFDSFDDAVKARTAALSLLGYSERHGELLA